MSIAMPRVRRSRRVPAVFPVTYWVPLAGSRFREARGVDLSPDGLRFSCREVVPMRAGFLVELRLPGQEPVRTLGRAAWVRPLPGDGGFEVGGPLVEPTTAARLRIERFLRSVEAQPAH
ncbi:MAG: PilZ domain-containing protein [Deltaproteobacteria bacterium]|nr:PilZ domain-containing protein [Deltaproteobacteria bacterium]